MCFQLQITPQKKWGLARLECYNRGGRFGVFENTLKLHLITKFIDEYMDERETIFVGGYAVDTGQWITVTNEVFASKSSLWGPGEPSGDGLCGDMRFRENWNPKWRINDEDCSSELGFVCQKPMTGAGKHFVYVVVHLVSSQHKDIPQVRKPLSLSKRHKCHLQQYF